MTKKNESSFKIYCHLCFASKQYSAVRFCIVFHNLSSVQAKRDEITQLKHVLTLYR